MEAIKAYNQATNIFPLFYEAFDNAGICEMDQGNYKEALPYFRNSLSLNSNNFTAQFALGYCFYQIKEYEKAKKEIEKSLTIKHDAKAKDLLREIQELMK